MKRVSAALLALALLCHVGPAWPEGEPSPPPTPGVRAGLEAASIAGTVVYTPVKGTLCFLGLVTSPLLYVSSGAQAVRDVTRRACTGSWVITPEILRGDTPFRPVQDTPCCGYAEP
jgi:hypothetical protein